MHQVRLIRNIRLGIKNLLLHKLRSLLTVLGVVFGVASVIAMLSVGEGASREALAQIRKLGSNNIILTAVKPQQEQEVTAMRAAMSVYGLRYEDEQRIRETIPAVKRTVPVKAFPKEARLGERSLELRIMGTTSEWFDLVKRDKIAGRLIAQRDVDEHGAVCVLTENGARKLLATEHSVGQSLRIGSNYYEVIGIVRNESGSSTIQIPDSEVDVYIPLNVAKEHYGDIIVIRTAGVRTTEMVELDKILVEVESQDKVRATANALTTMLQRFHKKVDYRIDVPLALLEQAEANKRLFNIVLGSIAAISLLVGGIGIMNIMLASVTERTREIGIRRAIGAKRRQIVMQFLVETAVLTCIGGLLGLTIGPLFAWAISYFSKMPTVVPLYSIVLSVGISGGIGLVFGLYPAMRASKLDPIVALRHE